MRSRLFLTQFLCPKINSCQFSCQMSSNCRFDRSPSSYLIRPMTCHLARLKRTRKRFFGERKGHELLTIRLSWSLSQKKVAWRTPPGASELSQVDCTQITNTHVYITITATLVAAYIFLPLSGGSILPPVPSASQLKGARGCLQLGQEWRSNL